VCEHGDPARPEGFRFCSKACADCEAEEQRSPDGCNGTCGHHWSCDVDNCKGNCLPPKEYR